MQYQIIKRKDPNYPEHLEEVRRPPQQLYVQGSLQALGRKPRVAIVGSRKVSPYGKKVTQEIAEQLAGQGCVIVSGLALGVDSLAHEAALKAEGYTIAVLPSPLSYIYPRTNRWLALKIIDDGGTIITEYPPGEPMSYKSNFIARNRLIAGLADVVLVTEAAEKSGSLHTARFANEMGKTVMAVPGDITKESSVGTNNLLRSGAMVATCAEDILQQLNLSSHEERIKEIKGRNPNEQMLLDLMLAGEKEGERLYEKSGLDISQYNQTLMMLELGGKVYPLGANRWAIR